MNQRVELFFKGAIGGSATLLALSGLVAPHVASAIGANPANAGEIGASIGAVVGAALGALFAAVMARKA